MGCTSRGTFGTNRIGIHSRRTITYYITILLSVLAFGILIRQELIAQLSLEPFLCRSQLFTTTADTKWRVIFSQVHNSLGLSADTMAAAACASMDTSGGRIVKKIILIVDLHRRSIRLCRIFRRIGFLRWVACHITQEVIEVNQFTVSLDRCAQLALSDAVKHEL